jgi:dTDP-glucose 4,6-dehydratase
MASESHVDRSISSPVPFVENNVGIGLSMLEYARVVKPKVFVQVSTDEVYGPMIGFKRHEEWDRLIPSNPYSASKAAQEMLAISYWRTYKLPVVITNTVNNFGERQDVEKFIPTVIKHILEGLPVPIHGKRGNIGSRFWLHARNHADAIMFILKNLVPTLYSGDEKSLVPDRYNITSDDELNNLDLAKMIAAHLKKKLKYRLIDFHTSRPGHDMKYGISGNLLRKRGWKQPVTFEASLFKTIDWTIEHPEWLK